jgi:hypothetical protein
MLEFFNLGAWWLRTFSPVERQYIEQRYQQSDGPSLTQGHIDSSPFSAPQFLANLAMWLRPEDASITARITAKVDDLAVAQPTSGPGYFQGRHYTAYVEEVKALKHNENSAPLESLLLTLVDAIEAEAHARQWPVAPWYYQELAVLYRKRKDYAAELAVIERYKHQPHGADSPDDDLLKREAQARELLTQAEQLW